MTVQRSAVFVKLSVVALAVVAAPTTRAALAEPIGVMKRVTGDVRIERSGQHIPARSGSLIQRGDRVITGPRASASVNMRLAAPITVEPGNDVILDRFASDEQPTIRRPAHPILQGLTSFFALNRQR